MILDYRGAGDNLVLGREYALASVFPELGFELVGMDQAKPVMPGVGGISAERIGDIDADIFMLIDVGPAGTSAVDAILAASGAAVARVQIELDRPSTGPLSAPHFLAKYVDALAALG